MNTLEYPTVTREAALSDAVIRGRTLPAAADPTHAEAWASVRDRRFDWAVVVTETGYVLFRAWRVSSRSWAWQTPAMPAPAFAEYGGAA